MTESDWADLLNELSDLAERIGLKCFAGDESVTVQNRGGNVMLKVFADCPVELAQGYLRELKEFVRTP